MCVLDVVNLVLVVWLVKNEVRKKNKQKKYKKYME
jgi:hypothetical protein